MKPFVSKVREYYRSTGQMIGACFHAPTRAQAQVMLFLFGVVFLTAGLVSGVSAQGLQITYNDSRVTGSVNAILTYMEGSFGALVMVAAGIAAILAAAFGQYKAALGALVVAVGAFILRSFLSTFFNDTGIQA